MAETEFFETTQLIALLQTKSRDAFSKLYDSYSGALFGIICRTISNKTTAEDLLQDVFVKIWKNIEMYEPSRGTLFTWMLNITRNTCIDHMRSKQYKKQMQTSSHGLEHVESFLTSSKTAHQDDGTELRTLTHKLEEKYREVIDLVYFMGYSQEEVSQMLNLPLGTVKTRSRTGLQQLRILCKQ